MLIKLIVKYISFMAFTRPQISNKGKLFDIIELTLKADKTKYRGMGRSIIKTRGQIYIYLHFLCRNTSPWL